MAVFRAGCLDVVAQEVVLVGEPVVVHSEGEVVVAQWEPAHGREADAIRRLHGLSGRGELLDVRSFVARQARMVSEVPFS